MGSRPPRACFAFDAHARVETELDEPTGQPVTCVWDDVERASASCSATGSAGLGGVSVNCSAWRVASGHCISRWRELGQDPHTEALTSYVDEKRQIFAPDRKRPVTPKRSSASGPQPARRIRTG